MDEFFRSLLALPRLTSSVLVSHLLLSFLSPSPNSNNSYVYSHNTGLQAQSVMYTVASPGGDEEPVVLLDPNKLSEDGTVSLVREREASFFSSSSSSFFLFLLLPLRERPLSPFFSSPSVEREREGLLSLFFLLPSPPPYSLTRPRKKKSKNHPASRSPWAALPSATTAR